MYKLDYSTSEASGNPTPVMAITENTAPITGKTIGSHGIGSRELIWAA
jgi:hypothetical protein